VPSTCLESTPAIFPETLFDDASEEAPVDGDQRRWWGVYTRSRQEKALARELFAQEVPYYLPLVKKVTWYGRRRITADLPVFSSYLFLYGSEEERVGCLATNRVSRLLSVAEPERLRFDLSQLRRLIAAGAPLTIESRLAPGRRVRIKRGPLAGLEGIVLERRSGTRLLVGVDFLQQGASVAIDDFSLEPLDWES